MSDLSYHRSAIECLWEHVCSFIQDREVKAASHYLKQMIELFEVAQQLNDEDRNYRNEGLSFAKNRLDALMRVNWTAKSGDEEYETKSLNYDTCDSVISNRPRENDDHDEISAKANEESKRVKSDSKLSQTTFEMFNLPDDLMLKCLEHVDRLTQIEFSKTSKTAYDLYNLLVLRQPRGLIPKFTAITRRVWNGDELVHVLAFEIERQYTAHAGSEDLFRYTFLKNTMNHGDDDKILVTHKGMILGAYKDENEAIRDRLHFVLDNDDVDKIVLNVRPSQLQTIAEVFREIPRLCVKEIEFEKDMCLSGVAEAIGKFPKGMKSKFTFKGEMNEDSALDEEYFRKILAASKVTHFAASGSTSDRNWPSNKLNSTGEMIEKLFLQLYRDWAARKREIRCFAVPYRKTDFYLHTLMKYLPENSYELVTSETQNLSTLLKLKRDPQVESSDVLADDDVLFVYLTRGNYVHAHIILTTREELLFGKDHESARRVYLTRSYGYSAPYFGGFMVF